ncbi:MULTISPECIES: hypothetical protein [Stenotrophomonas]|uniref:hypothetical protein n=1 Tax=Stenotrophomonas TaxID=40323 RepID=UPI000A4ED8D7|nr:MULTISPECIES: hypothetical protein [Stenotrophomonas]
MEISQQAKARMVDLLRPMLAKAMVDTDGDLDFDFYEECQALERIPPEKVQNQLNAMAGEQPISQILFDQIEREIGERSSAEEEVPLTSLPGFEDPEAAAVRLIESLASLPRSYTLTVRMPTQLGLLFEDTLMSWNWQRELFFASSLALRITFERANVELTRKAQFWRKN